MSDVLSKVSATDYSHIKAVRTPATGACGCHRHSCWHQRVCRSSGVVKILRAPHPETGDRSSVILCRECAAPTPRKRVA